jgi:hypothetical protein
MASTPTVTAGSATYRHGVIPRHGGPDVLSLVQAPLPTPQAGEVRVRLTAAVPGQLVLMGDRPSDLRESDPIGV